jgi:hypothetical protein
MAERLQLFNGCAWETVLLKKKRAAQGAKIGDVNSALGV